MMASADQAMVEKLGPLEDTLEEVELEIPLPDGTKSHTVIHRPSAKAAKPPGPLIVLYYGGGFILGSPATMAPYSRGLARIFDAVVVSPTYRAAPEHPFPVGINDAWDCLKWCAINAKSIGADPSKGFITGGISAGANFGAVLARRAVEEQLNPPLSGQWISLLVAFRKHTIPKAHESIWTSWEQNKDTLVINAKDGETLFGHYKPDFESPLFNPLVGDFDVGKMPPAYTQVTGMDLIRDDGIVYDKVLKIQGVPTKLDIYPGVPHSFWHFFPQLTQSKKALVDIAEGFAWMLKTKVDTEKVPGAMWIPA